MIEVYRLTLSHYAIDEESGEKFKIDDPVVVQQVFDHRYGGVTIVLNRMFEQMKSFVLNQVGEVTE